MRGSQLGFQVHAHRHALSSDFPGTLAHARSLGCRAVELCSFIGWSGSPWGDFGALSDLSGHQVREHLDAAGLSCDSTHVKWKELSEPHLARVASWARQIGITHLTLSAIDLEGTTPREWRQTIKELHSAGERVQAYGLHLACHTQASIWRSEDRARPIDFLVEEIQLDLCKIELDPTGAILHYASCVALIESRPDCFYAVHLRDGSPPAEETVHLPAKPLGGGVLDIASLVRAAEAASIEHYFVEMEVVPGQDPMAALASSVRYLRERGLVEVA